MTKAKSDEVAVSRRASSDRRDGDRRKQEVAVENDRRVSERRTKVPRRRQIDPTTCERDYSAEEVEFMNALEKYKRTSGRMFPTCSEVLEVIRSLGYVKAAEAPAEPTPAPIEPTAVAAPVGAPIVAPVVAPVTLPGANV